MATTSRTTKSENKISQTGISNFAFIFGLAALTAIAILLHLFWFKQGFYSIGWDESGRTLDAFNWITQKSLLNLATWWLPFYRVVVGTGLIIYPDLFLTPRIICFFFGVFSLWAVCWFAFECFHDKRVVLVTAVIGTFFSVRIVLSLAPLSSIMFILFIITGMASFSRWIFSGNDRDLLLCGVLIAISGTIRYEGWVFSGSIFALVFLLKLAGKANIGWNQMGLFFAIIFSPPVLFLFSYILKTNNPLFFIKDGATQYTALSEVFNKNPLVQFFYINTISLNILGILSAVYFFKQNSRLRIVMIAPLFALLAISGVLFINRTAQSGPTWRMAGVWSMLLLPFTAYLILSPKRFLKNQKLGNLLTLGSLLLILFSFTYHTYKIKEDSLQFFPESEKLLGYYLNDMLNDDPGVKIVIESYHFYYLNILVSSQHPKSFVLNSTPNHPELMNDLVYPIYPVDRESLGERNIKYLVFKAELFTEWLDKNPDVEKLNAFGSWSVYKLKDPYESTGS